MNLSACIVVRNQAIFLDRCLQSIKSVCNEIIIVHDGPCSDDSLKIAKRYKALIFIRPFIGEAEYHRPFAFGKSTGDWILQIDADEYLSAEALSEIPILIQS
ncbi:MAG: glycosyltransferase, partial [Bacteroidota bacterium]